MSAQVVRKLQRDTRFCPWNDSLGERKGELIVWGPKYETGVSKIDLQHRKLAEITNRLSSAGEDGECDVFLETVFQQLQHYVDVHFSEEENLMEAAGYPNLKAHQKTHEEFRETLRLKYAEFRKGNAKTVEKVLGFLKNWLLEHILKKDQEYVPWMGVVTA